MLQDTHFTNKEDNYIRTQWGFDCYFSNFASNSRGVDILFNNNFESEVKIVEKDDESNRLVLTTEIEGQLFTLINIFGQNKDDPEFYKALLQMINENENMNNMTGDFNLILNPEVDFVNHVHLNNPGARNGVLNLMNETNLIDVWRELNLEKQRFT